MKSGKQLYQRRVMLQLLKAKKSPFIPKRPPISNRDFEKRTDYNRREQVAEQTVGQFWATFVKDLCRNSSFHGLNYFSDSNLRYPERILWTCLIISGVFGFIYSISAVWDTYSTSSTETVIETTYFKVSDIAFPAVVLCDVSRVDWVKVEALNESVIYGYTNETKPLIRDLLISLATITFGDFDFFGRIKVHKHLFPKLKNLRIADLLLKVMRTCREMFSECWWRGHQMDCCSILELQKTEYGYCFSFNSDVSEYSKKIPKTKLGIDGYWKDPNGVSRPRRTGLRGLWSGLAVTVNAPSVRNLSPGLNLKPGIKVLIGEPRAFIIGDEITVYSGQFGNIHIFGKRVYSTEKLRWMSLAKRRCLFSDEGKSLGFQYYFLMNCKADCFKYYTYKYCKCSPDFMFVELDDNNPTYPPCTVEDLLCLTEHNLVFNNIMPNVAAGFFALNESGMMCNCPADCSLQTYQAEVSGGEELQATCNLYRTNAMFGFLDLIVSFGGCTGLFLGGSLLSCVELVYFLTLRLYYHWTSWNRRKKQQKDTSTPPPCIFTI